MKKILVSLIVMLAMTPVFACSEFSLNSPDGQCIINEDYEYERRYMDCEFYLDTQYPQLSKEGKAQVLETIVDWNSFDSIDDFYNTIDMLVCFAD